MYKKIGVGLKLVVFRLVDSFLTFPLIEGTVNSFS